MSISISNAMSDQFWDDNKLPLIALDAFNLLPGAAVVLTQTHLNEHYLPLIREAVVTKITRDNDSELVHIICRFTDSEAVFNTDNDLPKGSRFGDTFSMTLDFNEKIMLFGLNVNPNDKDDSNNGV